MSIGQPGRQFPGQQDTLPFILDGRKVGRRAISPKRPPVETAGLADIFPYYAGFSFDWARSELNRLSGGDGSKVVLDPWNGSGTTTLAAQYDGYKSIGVDLNPVANIVVRARFRTSGESSILAPPPSYASSIDASVDPLRNWFDDSVVCRLRDWTERLAQAPVELPDIAYLAIFRMVRKVTKKFEGSNPTWVKKAKSSDDLVGISPEEVDMLIMQEQNFLAKRMISVPADLPAVALLTASATSLPVKDSSVDVILTSPPYLTRIDYGVAYSRELAVLGHDIGVDRTIRSGLMGTTLIRPDLDTPIKFGSVGSGLLRKISMHDSKASSGYYLKQARQYLDDLCRSFDELTRVAKPGAKLCLVVQDSYYKDIPVLLGDICINEARRRGWVLEVSEPFPVIRSLMSMNKSAREYIKGEVVESVITLRMPVKRVK